VKYWTTPQSGVNRAMSIARDHEHRLREIERRLGITPSPKPHNPITNTSSCTDAAASEKEPTRHAAERTR
jgi:phage terminase small subunit